MQITMELAKTVAVFGGVIIGIFAVFSSSWVWLQKQILGYGGAALCGMGTILIVASIFQSVTLGVSAKGLEFKLAEIQEQLRVATAAINDTKVDVQRVQASVRTTVIPAATQFQNISKEINTLTYKVEGLDKKANSEAIITKLNDLQTNTNRLDQKVQKIDNMFEALDWKARPNSQPVPQSPREGPRP